MWYNAFKNYLQGLACANAVERNVQIFVNLIEEKVTAIDMSRSKG